eukprot:8923460-Pyramimonas_sp.AAC.1
MWLLYLACRLHAGTWAARSVRLRAHQRQQQDKPRSRLSASQWQSVGRAYTSIIRWDIRNAVR